MNWMPRRPLYKVFLVAAAAGFFSLSEFVFMKFGAFVYGHGFIPLISYIHSFAMLSILAWLCLDVVGEETIYGVRKSRFWLKSIFQKFS